MKKTSPTTYKVGSIGEFAAWTKRVICDPPAALDMPKEVVRQRGDGGGRRPGFGGGDGQALSPGNLAVLDAIKRHRPASVRELAILTGRKEASLSRTLKRFVQVGIVAFEDGPHRARVPALVATPFISTSTLPGITAPSGRTGHISQNCRASRGIFRLVPSPRGSQALRIEATLKPAAALLRLNGFHPERQTRLRAGAQTTLRSGSLRSAD